MSLPRQDHTYSRRLYHALPWISCKQKFVQLQNRAYAATMEKTSTDAINLMNGACRHTPHQARSYMHVLMIHVKHDLPLDRGRRRIGLERSRPTGGGDDLYKPEQCHHSFVFSQSEQRSLFQIRSLVFKYHTHSLIVISSFHKKIQSQALFKPIRHAFL